MTISMYVGQPSPALESNIEVADVRLPLLALESNIEVADVIPTSNQH